MSIELTIVYDGTSESLRTHRLSLGEFSKPLGLLLNALQRTASGMVGKAEGTEKGRLAGVAKRLDVQITSIEGGCVQLNTSVVHDVAPSPNLDLDLPGLDLAERAVKQLLTDLDEESHLNRRSLSARNYLRALPPSVTKHQYVAKRGGRIIHQVTLGSPQIAQEEKRVPRIGHITGLVSAVGLEFGRETVTLKNDDGAKETLTCTTALVERALALRSRTVRATFVSGVPDAGRVSRLLRIDEVGADVAGDPDARLAEISKKWEGALAALAK